MKDYIRILACLSQGLSPKDTAFVANVSENLIYEYVSLIEKNQLDIKEQKDIKGGNDFDDLPF